jgi:hypothetical protein
MGQGIRLSGSYYKIRNKGVLSDRDKNYKDNSNSSKIGLN